MQIPKTSGWFSVQATSTINAPIERVWTILTDLDHYHEWNSFIPSMQASPFAVGSTLTMGVRMNPNTHTTSIETITAIEPQHLLAWKTRSPKWFLSGERFQEITAIDPHTTRYWTRESFSGILAPVLQILLAKDLQRNFNAMANDLKAHAETMQEADISN
jgi:hypothetical protein